MEDINNKNIAEDEIDLKELIRAVKNLWKKNKKFILIASAIGFLSGIIIAFSIPKEYNTVVILAPESESSNTGNMGALAAMAGINMGASTTEGLSSELYPSIIQSTPFIMGLFDIKVSGKNIDTDVYTYINKHQKGTWWSYIIKAPFKILELFRAKPSASQELPSDNFTITKEQYIVIESIKSKISVGVDKKTGVITLSSVMQDAKISAFIADTLTSYLQSYIISYRTQKARQDLKFTEKLYTEAKKEYSDAQEKYARYSDKNQNVIMASYRITQEKLQNEMTLAYGVYNQMAQQLQMAKVKVQDITPVYTVIQPSFTPLSPSKPNKKLIVIGFTFLAFISACGWILAKKIFKD